MTARVMSPLDHYVAAERLLEEYEGRLKRFNLSGERIRDAVALARLDSLSAQAQIHATLATARHGIL